MSLPQHARLKSRMRREKSWTNRDRSVLALHIDLGRSGVQVEAKVGSKAASLLSGARGKASERKGTTKEGSRQEVAAKAGTHSTRRRTSYTHFAAVAVASILFSHIIVTTRSCGKTYLIGKRLHIPLLHVWRHRKTIGGQNCNILRRCSKDIAHNERHQQPIDDIIMMDGQLGCGCRDRCISKIYTGRHFWSFCVCSLILECSFFESGAVTGRKRHQTSKQ